MKLQKKISTGWLVGILVLAVIGLNPADFNGQKRLKRSRTTERRQVRIPRRERIHQARTFGYAKDRILVKFGSHVSDSHAESLIQDYRFRSLGKTPQIGVYKLEMPPDVSVEEALAAFRADPAIEHAGLDHRRHLAVTPTDPFFASYQYNLRNTGRILYISPEIQPDTTAGADIKATSAWDETTGDESIIIAILDTGVDMTHPELANKIVSSGRDFVNDDFDATDDHWHGTQVAGIAAAETNNAEGIAGVAWGAKILPVKVLDEEGWTYTSSLIDGIIWAVDNGAQVINLSLGGPDSSELERQACQYAYERNVVICAAAGNVEGPVYYPAAYDEYVLAVSATDYNDEFMSFSNFGPEVDVAAPGAWILGPVPEWVVDPGDPPYYFVSGTSQSAPHVAGLAALILGIKPWLSAEEVMNIIRYTADDVNAAENPGKDPYMGYGRINMERALVPYIIE